MRPVTATLYKTFADNNMLIPNLSAPLPVETLKSVGIHELPGGLKVEDYDYLHTSIFIDEVSLCHLSHLCRI
jgi:acyl-CoA dehydrogenase